MLPPPFERRCTMYESTAPHAMLLIVEIMRKSQPTPLPPPLPLYSTRLFHSLIIILKINLFFRCYVMMLMMLRWTDDAVQLDSCCVLFESRQIEKSMLPDCDNPDWKTLWRKRRVGNSPQSTDVRKMRKRSSIKVPLLFLQPLKKFFKKKGSNYAVEGFCTLCTIRTQQLPKAEASPVRGVQQQSTGTQQMFTMYKIMYCYDFKKAKKHKSNIVL